jgi:hypothetical protein
MRCSIVFAYILLGVLGLGCGSDREKGIYKDLDRPRSTEKTGKGTDKDSKTFLSFPGPHIC